MFLVILNVLCTLDLPRTYNDNESNNTNENNDRSKDNTS